jgi:hypothetical protein
MNSIISEVFDHFSYGSLLILDWYISLNVITRANGGSYACHYG